MIKTFLAAATLAILPGLSLAMGCSSAHEKTAMTCAEGSSYDSEAGKCIPQVTG